MDAPSSIAAEPSEERLWGLHSLAVGMVERQVDRAWSTTQFFILLNVTVVGGAFALLQMSAAPPVAMLLLVVLVGGAALSVVAARVAAENKRYYRRLVAKKTLLEERLSLTRPIPGYESQEIAVLSLGPTATIPKISSILAAPDKYAEDPLRRGSITNWAVITLYGFAAFDLFAAAVVFATLLS